MNTKKKLLSMLKKQITNFFDYSINDNKNIQENICDAYKKSINCFKNTNNKYYIENKMQVLHSGQYAVFLYFISHTIFENIGRNETSEKIYYLNKIMHSLDIYYEVKLPYVFYLEHPLGTVLGRASYGECFTAYQSCTVGGSWDKDNKTHYPVISENVTLLSYACVLGNSKVGKNSIIASHAYLLNQDVPDNSIAFGQGNNLVIKPNKKNLNIFR